MNEPIVPRLLTVAQDREYTGRSDWTIRKLVLDNVLDVVRLLVCGRKWWLDKRNLDALIDAHKGPID